MQATYTACICLNMGRVWRGLGLIPLISIPTYLLQPITLVAMLLVTFSFVCQTHLPLHLILYYLAPVFAWHRALSTPSSARQFSSSRNSPVTKAHLGMTVGALLILVSIAASFHDRRWLSLGLLLIIIFLVKSASKGSSISFVLKNLFAGLSSFLLFLPILLFRHISASFYDRY